MSRIGLAQLRPGIERRAENVAARPFGSQPATSASTREQQAGADSANHTRPLNALDLLAHRSIWVERYQHHRPVRAAVGGSVKESLRCMVRRSHLAPVSVTSSLPS